MISRLSMATVTHISLLGKRQPQCNIAWACVIPGERSRSDSIPGGSVLRHRQFCLLHQPLSLLLCISSYWASFTSDASSPGNFHSNFETCSLSPGAFRLETTSLLIRHWSQRTFCAVHLHTWHLWLAIGHDHTCSGRYLYCHTLLGG